MLCFKGIHLLSITVKDKISYQFNKQTCFASKAFTYFLQPPRRPRSVINLTSRHALLQRHSLTTYNRREGQGQLSIQQVDMLCFKGIHLQPTTAEKAKVSYQFNKQTCFASKAFTYKL